MAAVVRTLLRHRDADKTICPSDVARTVGGDGWRRLMPAAREVAADLADQGVIEVRQRGEPVDIRTAKGPVRLARGAAWTVPTSYESVASGPAQQLVEPAHPLGQGGLGPVVGRLVVLRADQHVRQVLLRGHPAGLVVRVPVALTVPVRLRAGVVRIPQVRRHQPDAAGLDVGRRRPDRLDHRIGLRGPGPVRSPPERG